MTKISRQAILALCAAIFIILFATESRAQQVAMPKADNSIHDRMYTLIRRSETVILPETISSHVRAINQSKPNKEKIMYAQLTVLKVLHNPALEKEDIRFFGNQLLQHTSEMYSPIRPEIKKILDNL